MDRNIRAPRSLYVTGSGGDQPGNIGLPPIMSIGFAGTSVRTSPAFGDRLPGNLLTVGSSSKSSEAWYLGSTVPDAEGDRAGVDCRRSCSSRWWSKSTHRFGIGSRVRCSLGRVVSIDPIADCTPEVAHQSLMPLADGIHGCSGGCGITGNLQGFPLRHGGRESVLPAS